MFSEILPDCCRPSAVFLVLVNVEDDFLPGRFGLHRSYGGPHVEGVRGGGNSGLQPRQTEDGGEPVRDVDQPGHQKQNEGSNGDI